MSILNVLHYPDERLRRVALAIENVDDNTRKLIDDMFETMYGAPGIGLAAVQVDVLKRLIIIDLSENKDQPFCFINPQILSREGKEKVEEGCLSVPGIYADVTRSKWIKIQALDRQGDPFEQEFEGLMAICVQHEIDHLDGKLFVDYLSEMKRVRIRKKMEKLRRQTF
ncbi:MAG: peptide deformylase [Gammaproteobacteria bacterium]|nr:peptide deformylase [Gammaproteobacteria bacterium]